MDGRGAGADHQRRRAGARAAADRASRRRVAVRRRAREMRLAAAGLRDRGMIRARLLWRVSRPGLAPFVPMAFLVGAALAGAGPGGLALADWLLVAALGPPFGLVIYGANDIHDYASDRRNRLKEGRGHGRRLMPRHHGLVARAAALASAVVVGSAALSGTPALVATVAGLLAVGVLYSVPPVRLKTRPPLDSLANAVIYGAGPLLAGWLAAGGAGPVPQTVWVLSLYLFGFHAFSTLRDLEVDRASGDRTIAVVWGPRAAAGVGAAASLVALAHFAADGRIGATEAYFALSTLVMGWAMRDPRPAHAARALEFLLAGVAVAGGLFLLHRFV